MLFKWKAKKTGRWKRIPDAIKMQIPLMNFGGHLGVRMRKRIIKRNRDMFGGKWKAYERNTSSQRDKHGRKKLLNRNKGWFWATPGMKQPETNRILIKKSAGGKSGVPAGSAAYPSYGDYKDGIAHGRHQDKDFDLSGKMWKGLIVKAQQPGKVSVVFDGKRGGKRSTKGNKAQPTNLALATIISSRERYELLAPSRKEIASGIKLIEKHLTVEWAKELKARNEIWKLEVKMAGAKKKVEKAAKLAGTTRAGFAI